MWGNVQALTRALGAMAPGTELTQPVAEALRLRALATDDAEQRLRALGTLLDVGAPAPGTDPALAEGYRAAAAEFAQVRQGVWPAVADSLQRNQGKLAMDALKEIVLSRLAFWAVFGYMGWQGAEGAVNAEYHGQYAVCLATEAAALAGAADREPRALPEALCAELTLNYELTEALKAGQVMPLKPAGGLGDAEWQIRCAERSAELRRALSPSRG